MRRVELNFTKPSRDVEQGGARRIYKMLVQTWITFIKIAKYGIGLVESV